MGIAIDQELSRGKTEALKLMDEDMDIRLEELRKEKDAEIDTLLKIKLGEAKDDHQRLLRLAEEQYRSRLSELQEEKDLVLEEKELRCQSLITQHQNNQQGIQEELSMLKQELDKKEKAIEKIREEGLGERRSWVQQIEENRLRHLDEIQLLKTAQEQQMKTIQEQHKDSIESAILNIKDSHRNELERAQQQHEELLLAANEDVESSAKSQLDQLYVLLRDKESELNQRNGSLKKLEDQLNIKHENISQLDSQITDLKAQLTSFQQSTDELKQSKEELVVHREKITTLEQTVETLNNLIAASETEWKIILEERNELKIKDMDVEVSKQTISELRESIDRLNDVVKSKELDIERITNEKDQHQCEFDRLNSQQIANNTEWEQKLDESKHQSAAKEVKIKELIRVLSDKETLIETLQKDMNQVSNLKTSSDEETKRIL